MSRTFTAIILLLFVFTRVSAQTIEPSTMNVGGGSFWGNSNIAWSIGEGASIETFQSTGDLIVTTGVLQPFTEKMVKPNYLASPWTKDEIAIFPVPTHTIVEIDIKINEPGKVSMLLLDQRGQPLQTRTFSYTGLNGVQKFDLTGVTAGVYYINVALTGGSSSPVIRKGTFKIQKL
jgi:hypothetical protein